MKTRLFNTLLLLSFCLFVTQSYSYSQTKQKDNKHEVKLSVDDKLKVLSSELKLTEKEKSQIKNTLTNYQNKKEKIKAMNLPKKEENNRVDKLKEVQKKDLRKILGDKRYEQYKELKKKDKI